MFQQVRSYLKKIGLPDRDLENLPSSEKRFDDGSHFKIEIPTVNSVEAMDALLNTSIKLGIRINRVTETYGMFRHTQDEIKKKKVFVWPNKHLL